MKSTTSKPGNPKRYEGDLNINLIKFKGIIKELHGIRVALERIADAMDTDLNDKGLRPPKDIAGPEPTFDYTDEAMDWAKEEIAFLRRIEIEKDKEHE